MKRPVFLLIAALIAAASAAYGQTKYIAVVETEVDEQSGVSARLNKAEVREITAVLRDEAKNNLPSGKYKIMTAETVIAQGSAKLEECAEENCVIALGAQIGADYIVRGTVGRFGAKLTLSVVIYETEDGTLVGSARVSSEKAEDLLESAAAACAAMYKTFVSEYGAAQKASAQQTTPLPPQIAHPPQPPPPHQITVVAPPPPPPITYTDDRQLEPTPKPKPTPKPTPKHKPKFREWSLPQLDFSYGGGVFFSSDFGGGLKWRGGEQLEMPYYGGGAYLFFDLTFMDAFIGYSGGGGNWQNTSVSNPGDQPYMQRSYMNMGMSARYPIGVGNVKLSPIFLADGEFTISSKLIYDEKDTSLSGSLDAAWLKVGAGVDFDWGKKTYWRVELMYGWRISANEFEEKMRVKADKYPFNSVETRPGNGLSLRIGFGVRLFDWRD